MPSRLNVTLLGHKDHGKSTLIGRLSYDTGSVMEDRVAEVKATCEARGHVFEYAFLLDAFTEERENGMTIDVIHAQIKGKRHHYDCIDVPGHQELIKNMLTGASHAEAGILIVSAHEGIEDQTGQHLRLAQWLGLGRLVVAVNKMDRAQHSEKKFDQVRAGMLAMVGGDAERLTFIPVAALGGENVVHHSAHMPWYTGPTLFEALEEIEIADGQPASPCACRYRPSTRARTASSWWSAASSRARCASDQRVAIAPGGAKAKVKVIRAANKDVGEASAGDNVGLVLEEAPRAIKRGHVVCAADNPIEPRTELTAPAIFLEETPRTLVAECGTAETGCEVEPLAPAEIGEVAACGCGSSTPCSPSARAAGSGAWPSSIRGGSSASWSFPSFRPSALHEQDAVHRRRHFEAEVREQGGRDVHDVGLARLGQRAVDEEHGIVLGVHPGEDAAAGQLRLRDRALDVESPVGQQHEVRGLGQMLARVQLVLAPDLVDDGAAVDDQCAELARDLLDELLRLGLLHSATREDTLAVDVDACGVMLKARVSGVMASCLGGSEENDR